jgi:hypothetical protein
MPAALPELAAEAVPLLLELARGVCCGEHSLTTGNLREDRRHPGLFTRVFCALYCHKWRFKSQW